MEQIENEQEAFEGELLIPNEREHIFRTLDAMLDFVKVFKIENGNFRTGYKIGGNEKVYQLIYQTQEN